MAKCSITEFSGYGRSRTGQRTSIPGLPVTIQSVTYTSAAQSAAFNAATSIIRVCADADVYLLFGANPTADAADIYLPADTVEFFTVKAGDKVSCYDGVT